MSVYMFRAAFYCEDCGRDLPQEPVEGGPYDSDEYAIETYDLGEADSPQHCDRCWRLLDFSLTSDGIEYVREALQDGSGDPQVLAEWREAFADQL
jgi:hypothetical protein